MFKAGGFTFPTTTGAFSVSGLGFQPQGIIFFGGNQAPLDTLLTPAAPGVFFGMAWRDKDSGAIDYQAQANTVFGVRWRPRPICAISTGVSIDYEASAVSFDADGFTLTVSVAAPASRTVHWLAWGGLAEARGKILPGTAGGQVFDIASLAARPLSALAFSMFASGAARDSSAAGFIYYTMGVGNFPELNTDALNNNATAITFRSTGTTSEGWTQQYLNQLDDAILASVASGPAGTYQTNVDHLRPYPAWTDQALRATLFGTPNLAALAWLSQEGSVHFADTPNVGATSIVTARANIQKVEAALFFGTTAYASEEQLGIGVAYLYGVLTKGYQGVVAFDSGKGTTSPAFIQSKSACYANALTPAGGVRLASGEIIGNAVRLTGVLASNPQIRPSFVQLWGGPSAVWIPQIYRRNVVL